MTSPSHLEMQADIMIRSQRDIFEDQIDQSVNDDQTVPGSEVRGKNQSLYDFLERQTRNQIRHTLGNPMAPVSRRILDNVRRTDEHRNMKQVLFKTPGRPNRREERQQSRSAQRMRYLNASASKFDAEGGEDLQGSQRIILRDVDMPHPNEVRDQLKQLQDNIKDKQSLVDLFRQKLSQNKGVYQQLRARLEAALQKYPQDKEIQSAQALVIDLQNQNQHWHGTLDDNQNANAHMLDDLIQLISIYEREKQGIKEGYQNQIDRQRGYDKVAYDKQIDKLTKQNEDLSHENKILQESLRNEGQQESSKMLKKVSELESLERYLRNEIKDKDRQKNQLHSEMNKLNNQLVEVEKVYSRELDAQKDRNQTLLEQIQQSHPTASTLTNEMASLTHQNNQLKQQIHNLNSELDRQAHGNVASDDEVMRVRRQMTQQRDEYEGELESLKSQIENRDQQRTKQKNQWAEIYGNLKQEIEDQKQDIQLLNNENERLVQQMQILDTDSQVKGSSDREIAKRLKKKELECNQLWDTIKEMHINAQNKRVFDSRDMIDMLAVRQLDSKAKRKLKLQ